MLLDSIGSMFKRLTHYRRFQMKGMEAIGQWGYKATADDELGFDKGDVIEVATFSAGWWYSLVWFTCLLYCLVLYIE